VDGSWGRWAIEVKTGEIDAARLRGLAESVRRVPRYRPIVVCDPAQRHAVERLGLMACGWPDFLLDGVASV